MFNDFLMFVAPGLTIIAAIVLSFWAAAKDETVSDENK
jgi:CydS-like protein